MKILNLYAGIGGNRKLWGNEHEVTAVEYNENIAKVYQKFFPKDKVIVADAHQFLIEHYQEFDFIWGSPPCPTHSRMRKCFAFADDKSRIRTPEYPDMRLYQEIIFLTHFFKGNWVIENVTPYYEPLIKPQKCGRHCFWSNFHITNKKTKGENLEKSRINEKQKLKGFDLSNIQNVGFRKDQVLNNCVDESLGLHIFKCAFKEKQVTLGNLSLTDKTEGEKE